MLCSFRFLPTRCERAACSNSVGTNSLAQQRIPTFPLPRNDVVSPSSCFLLFLSRAAGWVYFHANGPVLKTCAVFVCWLQREAEQGPGAAAFCSSFCCLI